MNPEALSEKFIDQLVDRIDELKDEDSDQLDEAITDKLDTIEKRQEAITKMQEIIETKTLGKLDRLKIEIAIGEIRRVNSVDLGDSGPVLGAVAGFADTTTDGVSLAVEQGNNALRNAADISEQIRKDTKEHGWGQLFKGAAIPAAGIGGLYLLHKHFLSPPADATGPKAWCQRFFGKGAVLVLGAIGTNYFAKNYLRKNQKSIRESDPLVAEESDEAETAKKAA